MAEPPTLLNRHAGGAALVAAQFALMGLLAALALPALRHGMVPGVARVLWANRPGNFNIRPVPRAGGQLVQHGPYRWIRHPMYTSVGCFAAGCAAAAGMGIFELLERRPADPSAPAQPAR